MGESNPDPFENRKFSVLSITLMRQLSHYLLMRKEDDSKPAFFDNLSVISVKYKTRTTCTIRFSFTREHPKNLGGNHPHFIAETT